MRIHFLCKQFLRKTPCIFSRNFVMWVLRTRELLWMSRFTLVLFQPTTNSQYSIESKKSRNSAINHRLKCFTEYSSLFFYRWPVFFFSCSDTFSPEHTYCFYRLNWVKWDIIEGRSDACSEKCCDVSREW